MSGAPSITPLVDRLCARFEDRDEGLAVVTDLMVLIASADSVIDETEKRALADSVEAMLASHVAPRLLRVVVEESRARIRGVGPELSADGIGRKLASHRAAEDGIRLAVFIAAISEGISVVERKRIERLAAAAGIAPTRVASFMSDPFSF